MKDDHFSEKELMCLSWLRALDLNRFNISIEQTVRNATEFPGEAPCKQTDVLLTTSVTLLKNRTLRAFDQHAGAKRLKPVVAMCSSEQKDIDQMLLEGVAGIVLPDDSPWIFFAALHAACDRMLFISPSVLTRYWSHLAGMINAPARERLNTLTDREYEVLIYTAQGYSNHDIAKKLYIASTTVGSHMLHILRKLDVSNRTEAATVALQAGIS